MAKRNKTGAGAAKGKPLKSAKTRSPNAKGKAAKTANDQGGTRRLADILGFDIKTEDLPAAIGDAAFASGDFPYARKLAKSDYEPEFDALQIELQKFQNWVKETGERVVIVLEGRDGAGKGGAITAFTQHLNPRNARVVALTKPSDTEKGQWYFQRYASQMPTRGEIVFFDRSWYNRAGVEPVMGFCSPEQHDSFLTEAPAFEGMLVRDGIYLIKLFLTIGAEMQIKRLHARYHDPLKRWKLSPIDFKAVEKFADYSAAFEKLLQRTDTSRTPWTVIRANDKYRARLNAIRFVLNALPYADKNEDAVKGVDRRIVLGAEAYLRGGGEE